MGFTCGIVGLPNVGKSTIFNALASAHAPASSYPFCNIDCNKGMVAVPDRRLHTIATMIKPPAVTPTVIEFVDIAGVVKGASRGEGLGNQFLGHIRAVDAVAHVVRCFKKQGARRPHRQAPEPAMTQPGNEQATPVPEAGAATDSPGDAGTAEALEPVAQSGGAVDAGVRERDLAAVLAHIESHKFYPLPARRRGLQGLVDVRFTLDARGMISNLDVTGSNSLFVEAARAAVRKALPLPAAPSIDGFPLDVRYQMIFKLQ